MTEIPPRGAGSSSTGNEWLVWKLTDEHPDQVKLIRQEVRS